MNKIKKIIGYAALVLSLTAVATAAYAVFVDNPEIWWANSVHALVDSVIKQIKSDGISSNLSEYLASRIEIKHWLATIVIKQDTPRPEHGYPEGQVVAASNPNLIGLSRRKAEDHISNLVPGPTSGSGGGWQSQGKPVAAPGGSLYFVAVYGNPPHRNGFAWLFGTVPFYAVIGAWLAVAAWVTVDVWDRQKANAVAWSLLSLATGPVALGVWLISRPSVDKSRPAVCPSCGSAVPWEAAYCVRCGHPVAALCPKCGKRVQVQWAYCGSCGTLLADDGSASIESQETLPNQ